jgi:RHS repeat-associated protein
MVMGLDGALAAIRDNAGTRVMLTNLHGDVVAATSPDASTELVYGDTDAFGVPRQGSDRQWAWLGGRQRSTELAGGTVAMGVRTYVPQLGRFLQVDSVPGGSANSYDYGTQDPCSMFDIDGRSSSTWRMIPGVRCGVALARLMPFVKKMKRQFAEINDRRWARDELPVSYERQFQIIMMSGYAHDTFDYCPRDLLKFYVSRWMGAPAAVRR